MENPKISTGELKPPYGSPKWYEDFFELIQRRKVDKVDSEFLKLSNIAAGNEYKVIFGLRFLGLIDENGNATDKLKGLMVVGEEFNKNLEKVVKEAYSDLFSKVNLEKALPQDLINYFIRQYGMAISTAKEARRIFVFLAQKANIPISEELLAAKVERRPAVPRVRRERKPKREVVTPAAPPEGIHEIKWGDIWIRLPKGDKKAASQAKDLIDLYIKGLEE